MAISQIKASSIAQDTITWGYSVNANSDWGWDAAIMITATEIKV